jgi:hypothetical protein
LFLIHPEAGDEASENHRRHAKCRGNILNSVMQSA